MSTIENNNGTSQPLATGNYNQGMDNMTAPTSFASQDVPAGTNPALNLPPTTIDPSKLAPDYESFLDKLDFSQMTARAYGPSPINAETSKLIEMAAIPIDRVMSGSYNNMNSSRPGRVTGGYDPYSSAGVTDLSTKQGRNHRLAQAFNNAAELTPENKTPNYQDPMRFGSKKFNLDRFMAHPKYDKLGFHPLMNNEDYYNKNSTWYNDSSRMWPQYFRMFGNAFESSYRNIGDLVNGQWTWSDPKGAEVMEDAMRIGASTRGGLVQGLNNTWLSSAYTMGIIGSIAVEEAALALATVASGFTSSAATGTAMVGSLVKGSRGIYNSVKGAAASLKALTNLTKNVEKLRDFYNTFSATKAGSGILKGAGATGKFAADWLTPSTLKAFKDLRTAQNTGENLTNLAKTRKVFGAFWQDARMINLAVAESRIEAGIVENETFSKLYDEFVNANGRPPSREEIDKFRAQSIDAARTTFMFNAPVIWLSNKLVLERYLTKTKALKDLINLKGMGARFVKSPGKFGKDVYKGFKNIPEMIMKGGLKHNAKYVGGAALRYSADGVVEGMQEVYQEAISAGVVHYYGGLYQQPIAAGYDIFSAAVQQPTDNMAQKALMHGLKNGPSWNVFASGFFTGMMVAPFSNVIFQQIPDVFNRVTDNETYWKNRKKREKYIEQTTEWLNKMSEDPAFYFDPKKINHLMQKNISHEMFDHQYKGDTLEFLNAREHSLFSHLYTALELGKIDEFKSYINDLLKLNDEDLANAFIDDTGKVREGYTAEDLRKKFQGVNEKLDLIQENYNKFDEQYPNPFDKSKFEEGTQEYYEEFIREVAYRHAKMQMIFNSDAMTNASERMEQIKSDLQNNSALSKAGLDDINILTSNKGISAEIANLEREIASLKYVRDPQGKKDLAKAKKKKKLLEDFYNVLNDPANQHSSTKQKENLKRTDKRSIQYENTLEGLKKKIKEAYQDKFDNYVVKGGKEKTKVKDPVWGKFRSEKPVYTSTQEDGDIFYRFEVYDDGTVIYNADIITDPKQMDPSKGRKALKSEKQLEKHKKDQQKTTWKTVIDKRTGKPIKVRTKESQRQLLLGRFKRDPKSIKKLMKPFKAYMEFIAEENGGYVMPEKLENTLKMIVDYGHLNFRIADMYKANEILSDPKKLREYSEKLSKPLKRLWEKYKKSHGRRVRSFVSQEVRKAYLKALHKEGIYPDPDQVKAFLEKEEITADDIPSLMYTSTGEMINDPIYGHTNKGQYEAYLLAREKLLQELSPPPSPTDENTDQEQNDGPDSTIDDVVTEEAKEDTLTEDERAEKDAFKQLLENDNNNILEREYRKYRRKVLDEGGKPLSMDEWYNNDKLGGGIILARKAVYVIYDEDEDKSKYSDFDAWLVQGKNIRKPEVVKILEDYGLEDYQILKENVEKTKNIKEGVIRKEDGEIDVSKGQYAAYDIYIVRSPGGIAGNKVTWVYRIVDSEGKNVYHTGKFNNLNLNLPKGYDNEGAARNDVKKIIEALPNTENYEMDGVPLKKGDRVTKEGKNYEVVTDGAEFTNNSGTHIFVREEQFPEAEPVKIIAGDFKTGGWKKGKYSFKEITSKDMGGKQKLAWNSSMKFKAAYPADPSQRKSREEQIKDFQKLLREMTPERRARLSLRIERRDQHPRHGKDIDFKNGEINPLLKIGSKKLDVVLYDPETGEDIGYLTGLQDYTFIDRKSGKELINGPLDMNQENVFDYYIKYRGLDPAAQLKSIQQKYAQRVAIEMILDEILKENNSNKISLDLNNLESQIKNKDLLNRAKKIFVHVTLGSKKSVEIDNKNNPKYGTKDYPKTPFKKLKYFTVNKNGNIYIVDRSEVGADIHDFEDPDAAADMKAAIEAQGYGNLGGRFLLAVRLPSSQYTEAQPGMPMFHFIELQTTPKTKEEQDEFFNRIKAQQEDTTSNNLKGKGKIKDFKYNEGFNAFLQQETYIALTSGHNLQFKVQPSGDVQAILFQNSQSGGARIEVTFRQSGGIIVNKTKLKGTEGSIQDINTLQDFLDLISTSVEEFYEIAEQSNPQFIRPLGFGVDLKNKISLKGNQFRNIVDVGANVEDLGNSDMAALSYPEVVENLSLEMRYADPDYVKAVIEAAKLKIPLNQETPQDQILPNTLATVVKYQQVGWQYYPKAAMQKLAEKMMLSPGELTTAEKRIIAYTGIEEKVKSGEIKVNVEGKESTEGPDLDGTETKEDLHKKKKSIEDTIKKAEQELEEELYKQIEGENPDLSQEELNDIFDEKMDELEDNPPTNLKELNRQLKEIEKKLLAGKVIRNNNFDGHDVVDIDTFVAWAKENLPAFISILDIENLGFNLSENGVTVGTFALELKKIAGKINIEGKIYTGEKSPYKYHEAFHAVFRMLLTDAEIKKYLDIANKEVDTKLNSKSGLKYQGTTYKSWNALLKDFKKESVLNSQLTRSQLKDRFLEEYMADEFEKFKSNPQSTKTNSAIKNFFTRLVEWIKAIFRNYNGNDLQPLFNKIDSGKFQQASIQENRFTTLAGEGSAASGVTHYATKIVIGKATTPKEVFDKTTGKNKVELVQENIYMPSDEEQSMKLNIAAMLLNRLDSFEDGEIPPIAALLNRTVDDYINLSNPKLPVFKRRADYRKGFRRMMKERHENLQQHKDDIIEAVSNYLALYDIKVDFAELDADIGDIEEFTAGGVKAWEQKANQQGGVRKLAQALRLFIGTTTVEARSEDFFGVQFVPKLVNGKWVDSNEKLMMGVDAVTVYNGMLKAVSGTLSQMEMIQKLIRFAETNTETSAVVDRFMERIGVSIEDYPRILEYPKTAPVSLIGGQEGLKDPMFANLVIKQLQQFSSDYLLVERNLSEDGSGVVSIYAANHSDDVADQINKWRKAYFNLKYNVWEGSPKQASSKSAWGFVKFKDAIDKKKSLADHELLELSKKISKELKGRLGISLNAGYVRYSLIHQMAKNGVAITPEQQNILNDNSDAIAMTADDAYRITGLLQSNRDILSRSKRKFSDEIDRRTKAAKEGLTLDETEDGAEGRLKNIANGNAVFDEQVGATVFPDAKGDLIYSHQLPTFHLTKVAEINEKDLQGLEELKMASDPDTNLRSYISQNFLLNNPAFQALVEQNKLKVTRVSGEAQSLMDIDEAANALVRKGSYEGTAYADFSESQFLSTLLNMKLKGFNPVSGNLKNDDVISYGDTSKPLAPIFIRVIADSSTGDNIDLPTMHTVSYENGVVKFTDEYIESMKSFVQNEYERIQELVEKRINQMVKDQGIQKDLKAPHIHGFNTAELLELIDDENPSADRGYKLTNNANLVTAMIAKGMDLKDAIYQTAKIQMIATGAAVPVETVEESSKPFIDVPRYIVDRTLKNPDGSKRLAQASVERNVIQKGIDGKDLRPFDRQTIYLNPFTLEEFYNIMPNKRGAFIEELRKEYNFETVEEAVDYFKSIVYNLKTAQMFVLLHEQSHVDNKDYETYFKDGKTLNTPHKTKIETRANMDAFKKILNGRVRYTSADYVNFTGGAYGVDNFGDEIGREFGVTDNRHLIPREDYNKGRPRAKRLRDSGIRAVALTTAELEEGYRMLEKAEGKTFERSDNNDLKARNWFQVKYADSVYAMAEMEQRKNNTWYVKGGTGAAVNMAIASNKPVYVFDINRGLWTKWDGTDFKPTSERVTLTPKYAIVGTRNVESYVVPDGKGNWKSNPKYLGKEKEKLVKDTLRQLFKDTFTPYKTEEVQDVIPRELIYNLTSFLEKYGFDIHEADELFIDLATKNIDVNTMDIAQMSKALASPLSVMLSKTPWYNKIKEVLKESEEFNKEIDAALPKARAEMDYKDFAKIEDQVAMKKFEQLLENGFQERFRKELNVSDTLWDKIRAFLQDLLNFLKTLNADQRRIIKTNVDSIVDNTFTKGREWITTTKKEGYVKVDLQEAFDQLEIAHDIQTKIGTNPKIILTGSIAYSAEGTIYRQMDRVVHDLDYVSEMTPAENEALLLENYPGSVEVYNIAGNTHHTTTFITPPKGYKIDPKSIVRKTKENLKKGEAQLDPNQGKVIGYSVLNNKGEKVGWWKLDIAEDGTELGELADGVKATFVDFFTANKTKHSTRTIDFKGVDGKKHKIRIATFKSGMEFKLQFSRLKDIWDYNRFHYYKKTKTERSSTELSMQEDNIAKIENGTKTTTVRTTKQFKAIGLKTGETKIFTIGDNDYYVTNKGQQTVHEAGGLSAVLKSEGVENISDFKFPTTKAWAKGDKDIRLYVYTISPTEATPPAGYQDNDPTIIKKGVFEPNTDIKKQLETMARDQVPFEEALEKLDIPLEDVIKSRLNFEFDRFLTRLLDLNIIEWEPGEGYTLNTLDPKFQDGFKTIGGEVINEVNQDFNFQPGELIFNLRQIFFDDYRNTKSFNEVLFGDQATVYKNVIDAIKRAKGSNASGMNVENYFGQKISDTLTIRPSKKIAGYVHEDPQLDFEYTEGPQDIQDALVTMTLQGFAHFRAGLGKLSKAQAKLVDDLMQGKQVSVSRLLGNEDTGSTGLLQDQLAINSKKMVYDDGKNYVKMSIRILTPDFTTNLETSEPIEGREDLHNLRIKLERKEEQLLKENNYREFTPVLAIPETASKKFKKNMDTAENAYSEKDIDSNNVVMLDSKFMKLQQIVPTNKLEIVDPRQIQNLLTNEQYDDNVEVLIHGVKYNVGQIKDMYEETVGNRREFNYTNRRNLILQFKGLSPTDPAYNKMFFKKHLDKIIKGEVEVDLSMFRKYALNSLMAGKNKAQLLTFFENGDNLNNPFTNKQFQKLYFSFWKSAIASKQPGHSLTLVSDVGYKVVKKVLEVDEAGQPIRWDVIPYENWKLLKKEGAILALGGRQFADKANRTFAKDALVPGKADKMYYLDNLRHHVMEYKDGKPTGQRHTEMIMPAHHSSIIKNWKPGMPIPDVLTKGFGIRIPTQDKHSAANIKIVDWMPTYFGSSIIVPKELTEISGSDFDIDTMYTHFKEFYLKRKVVKTSDQIEAAWTKYVTEPNWNEAKTEKIIRANISYIDNNGKEVKFEPTRSKREYANMMTKKTGLYYHYNEDAGIFEDVVDVTDFVEFGTAETIKEEYQEYIRYMIKEAKKPGSSVRFAIEKHQDKEGVLAMEKFKKQDITINHNSLWSDIVEYLNENPLLLNVLRTEMHLPDSEESYTQYKKDNNGSEDVGGYVPYAGAYNNKILDMKYGLLGNKNITDPRPGATVAPHNESANLTPLTYEPKVDVEGVKDMIEDIAPGVWEIIKDRAPALAQMLDEGNIDIDNLYGKSVIKEANMGGLSVVGAAVQPNVITAIFGSFGVQVTPAMLYFEKVINPPSFNGRTYDNYSVNGLIDPTTGKEDPTKRKAYVISAIITALTDNAKEQLVGKIGLQVNALGIAVNMLALGIDKETTFGMINHPTVKNLLQSRTMLMRRIQNEIDNIKQLEKDGVIPKQAVQAARKSVTEKMLWDHIKEDSEEGLSLRSLAESKHILSQLQSLVYSGKFISKTIKILDLLTGPPQDLKGFEKLRQSAWELGLSQNDRDFNAKVEQPPFDLRPIFDNPKNHMGRIFRIFQEMDITNPSVFLAASNPFVRIEELLKGSLNLSGEADVRDRNLDRLGDNILSHLMIKAYMAAGVLNSKVLPTLKNSLIYPEVGEKSISNIVEEIRKVLKAKGKENYFIQFYIDVIKASDQGSMRIDQVFTNTISQLPDNEVHRIQTSFLELLDPRGFMDAVAENKADQHLAYLTQALVNYLIVKDGMQFKQGSFINAIPAHLFSSQIAHVERIHEAFKKLYDVSQMSIEEVAELKQELDDIFGEDFNSIAQDLVDSHVMHAANSNLIRKTFYPFKDAGELGALSPIQLDKGGRTYVEGRPVDESPTLVLDVSKGTGIEVQAYEGENRHITNNEIIPYGNEALVKNIMMTRRQGVGFLEGSVEDQDGKPIKTMLATFPYILKMEYQVTNRLGEPITLTKTFKISKLYGPKNSKIDLLSEDIFKMTNPHQLAGYRAEYVDVTGLTEGSPAQYFPGGRLFGRLPLTSTLKSDEEIQEGSKTEPLSEDPSKQGYQPPQQTDHESQVVSKEATDKGIKVVTNSGNVIDSNQQNLDRALQQEGAVGKGGSVLDLNAITGGKVNKEVKVTGVVDVSEDQKAINEVLQFVEDQLLVVIPLRDSGVTVENTAKPWHIENNIYSGTRTGKGGLDNPWYAAFTNPTKLAKEKGNLKNDYKVLFNDREYDDAEEAYQENKGKDTSEDFDVMVDIIVSKFLQHPKLMSKLEEIAFEESLSRVNQIKTVGNLINRFSHFPGQTDRWVGKGIEGENASLFLLALLRGYALAKSIDLEVKARGPQKGRELSASSEYNAFAQTLPDAEPIFGTSPGTKLVDQPYGIVVANTPTSEQSTEADVNLIKPAIKKQAHTENVGRNANLMFQYGLRWARVSLDANPRTDIEAADRNQAIDTVNELKAAGKKIHDGFKYAYHELDQEGRPLPEIKELAPIIEKIERALGVDMSDYNTVIGNIYLPNEYISMHRDTTEDISTRGYPVIVYTIGNTSGVDTYHNEKNPGAVSFKDDKKKLIPTTNGSIYTFGLDGKGRFELSHGTPQQISRLEKFPEITIPEYKYDPAAKRKVATGNMIKTSNYTITLTFRRATPLEEGTPKKPNLLAQENTGIISAPIYDDQSGQLEFNFVDEMESVSKQQAEMERLFEDLSQDEKQTIMSNNKIIESVGLQEYLKQVAQLFPNKSAKEIIEHIKKCS